VNRNQKTLSLVVVFILLFSGFSIYTAVPGTPYAVNGRVVDASTGEGVAGASVVVSNETRGETGMTLVSDENGFWGHSNALTYGGENGDEIKAVATKGDGYGENTGIYDDELAGGLRINIEMIFPIDVLLDVVHNQCAGTAVFTATVSGGDGDYTYEWENDGNGTISAGGGVNDTTMTIAGSDVTGTVTVTVSDNSGNQKYYDLGYHLNDALTGDGNWEAECDGDVRFTVNAQGGSPPYTYKINLGCDGSIEYEETTGDNSVTVWVDAEWGASGNWCWSVTDTCPSVVNGGPEAWEVPDELSVNWSLSTINHCTGEVYL